MPRFKGARRAANWPQLTHPPPPASRPILPVHPACHTCGHAVMRDACERERPSTVSPQAMCKHLATDHERQTWSASTQSPHRRAFFFGAGSFSNCLPLVASTLIAPSLVGS
eukprot:6540138-Prymnesium_polylepis.1